MIRTLAVDLGTSNTLVAAPGRDVIVDEPTVVALDARSGRVVSIGREARRMLQDGSPAHLVAGYPLQAGAITDFELTEGFLGIAFKRAKVSRLLQPHVVLAVSSTISAVERRAVEEAAMSAGARAATLIDETIASAIGAGLPIEQPTGSCIVNVGGGTTEVAVLSTGGIVASRAIRIGGNAMDDAIQRALHHGHGLSMGAYTAEAIKKQIGSACEQEEEVAAEIKGRDLATGMPKTVTVAASEIRAALADPVGAIVTAVRQTLADSPPELAHDVIERGITLTGGGSLLTGLDRHLATETDIAVHRVDEPLRTVIHGVLSASGSLERLRAAGLLT